MSGSRHLGVSIDRPAGQVYAYLSDPARLPTWAAGLGGSVEERDGRWFAASPMGEVEVAFVEQNPFLVADHDVTLPDGTVVRNPLRVPPDGDGCEVVFTLRRAPDSDDAAFEADAAAVAADLEALRELLEGGA